MFSAHDNCHAEGKIPYEVAPDSMRSRFLGQVENGLFGTMGISSPRFGDEIACDSSLDPDPPGRGQSAHPGLRTRRHIYQLGDLLSVGFAARGVL